MLGCAMGSAANGSGGCASGATAGVVGEVVGSQLRDDVITGTISKETAVQISGLAGSAASLATSIATGQSDTQTARNIFAGQNIGGNAARENALYVQAHEVAVENLGTGKYHTSLKIEPENQELWKNDPKYGKLFNNIDSKNGKFMQL